MENSQTNLNVHPAHTMDFDELREGLQKEVAAGYVHCQTDESLGLEIYKYSNSCTYEKHWNKFTISARGLILAPKEKQIVATGFPKFFNYGELTTELPNEPFDTFTKYDGSLGIIYFWRNKWRVATCLSFHSEQAQWAEKWLHANINLGAVLVPGATYLTEIIYPENRIVVLYDFSGLVMLGIYNSFGEEIPHKDIVPLEKHTKFRVASSYNYDSVDAILKICKTLPSSKEGFVVRFQNGYRVKIKGDEYVRIHKLISRCTPLAVWEAMRECDNMTTILCDLPEEFQKDLKNIQKILQDKYNKLLDKIAKAEEYTKDMSDKNLGKAIQQGNLPFTREVAAYLFPCRKKNFWEDVKKPSKMRRSVFDRFRPTANVLEGYAPSTAINRFEEDN